MKYIFLYIFLQLLFSCQNKINKENNDLDFIFAINSNFDSSYVYLEAEFTNNTDESIYITRSNWIFNAKSINNFSDYMAIGKSYVYNSIIYYPENDSLNKNQMRKSKLDFQSINGFILIEPKKTIPINIRFNNIRSINGKCNFFLLPSYKYNLLMDMTIFNESDFNYISNIINRNENQILIDSSSKINYYFGAGNRNGIYSKESVGLSKYNYHEKIELSELFQQNKYTFALSHVSYRDKDSIDAPY